VILEKVNKKVAAALVAGFLIGSITIVAIRFITIKSKEVHYHANFALFINGQQDQFDNQTFYEEVQACSGVGSDNPRGRAHLHKPDNNIVHIHDNAVTWGHFFANLSYGVGDDYLKTDAGLFIDDPTTKKQLSFTLNGQAVDSVDNRLINSQDVLLISYGDESQEEISSRFQAITKNAGEYNTKLDPASCSGSKKMSSWQRLKLALGLESL
jgi:hypothetical protein